MPRSARTGVLGMLVAILVAAALADSAAAAGRIGSIGPAVAERGGTVSNATSIHSITPAVADRGGLVTIISRSR